MAIKKNFKGTTVVKPGGFSVIDTTLLTNIGLGASGVVAIVGTADGGEPNVVHELSGSQINSAKETFVDGAIAKVLDLLANPSQDARVPSGASKILVYKTNQSTQATKALQNQADTPVDVLDLTSENYGVAENNINVQITAGDVEDSNAVLTGTPGAATYDMSSGTLVVTVNGTAYTYTPLAGDFAVPASATPAEVRDSLNTDARWAADRPVVASLDGNAVVLTLIEDAAFDANQLEYGVMVASGTLQTELDLPATAARGVKGSRIIILKKSGEIETSSDLGTEEKLTIEYTGAGTVAELSVQDFAGVKKLTTTITGGPGGEDLDIELGDQLTVEDLVDLINAETVYTCTSDFFNKETKLAKDELDYYLDLDILNAEAVLYGTLVEIEAYVNDFSELATADYKSNVEGQIDIMASAEFFTGGTKGGAANSHFQAAFDELKGHRVNVVVPLVSADGVGDDTFTVASVNSQCEAHVDFMNGITGKSERQGVVSIDGTKTEVKAAAKALNSQNVSIVFQKPTVLNNLGTLEQMDPYALACILAGTASGTAVGEPATHKLVRAVAMTQDASIDIKEDGVELIEAGVAYVEQTDSGAFRWAIDNTTYSKDDNGVFNRRHVFEAVLYTSYELRTYLETLFTGTKAATGIAEAIKNAAIFRLAQLRDEDILVDGNDDDGTLIPAFRDILVEISGGTAEIQVTITPVPGIDFILITSFVTELTASASA